jgi:tetratricopeptide (TPR) repeat protein
LHEAGQPAVARAELQTALRLADETGNLYQLAGAHRDLADRHESAGQYEQARCHWQQALDLYTQLSAPEADQVRSRLTGAALLVHEDGDEERRGVEEEVGEDRPAELAVLLEGASQEVPERQRQHDP